MKQSEQKSTDVLSSIRSLVATRPVPVNLPASPKPPTRPDRLLLTPALRVRDAAPLTLVDPVAPPRRTTLEDRIAELEAAVGAQADEFEPEDEGSLSLDSPSKFIFRRPEAPLRLEPARPPEQDMTPAFPASADPLPFSRAELRAIVAEIVREELQGELGQRMTRNIRKLVRREVQRAMMIPDDL